MTDQENERKFWFDTADRPHRRLQGPRLFKLLSLIRRSAQPAARRELGLSDFEWRVLSQVGDRAPMSLNELAAVSTHDKGQLSRGVKRLVEAGLLIRETRRGERGVFISPTEAGKKVFAQLVDLAFRQNDGLIKGLTPDELNSFNSILDKMVENAIEMWVAEQQFKSCQDVEPAPAPASKTRVRA